MKKLLCLFLLYPILNQSQDFQGKAYYMSKISVDKSWLDNPRFASRKGYMNDMIKRNTEKDYVLEFNSIESTYKQIEKLEAEGQGYNWMANYVGENIGKIYKNAQDKISINETEMMGKFFLVTENLENAKWKMSGESKKIGQYTCYKATYTKQVEEKVFSFGSWNQTNGTNQPKKPKKMRDVEVVAWFTPEIPVSSGPSWYQGLPGLILEVSDDDTTILCTKIVMNPKEKTKIKRPKKGKVISNQDFVTLQDEKRAERLEMWRQSRQRRQSSTARLR
jgi:GLPGLI family protein